MFDLTDIGFVKRIAAGGGDLPSSSDEASERAVDLLNRCLTQTPRGRIIGIEREVRLVDVGDQQVATQSVTYHVGWTRKPAWLDG